MVSVDLRGRVNNIHLNKADVLLPLFEAVVNSIQAIDARKKEIGDFDGKITVTIHRTDKPTGQIELDNDNKSLPQIIGFSIEDNGIGFDENNYESFNKSDSTYKMSIGGKGVGHLTWLIVFDEVHIHSVFQQDGTNYLRDFDFILDEDNNKNIGDTITQINENVHTTVHLNGFKEDFRIETKAYKRGKTIAEKIFYHCLAYYVTGSAPEIIVYDKDCLTDNDDKDSGIISLNDIFTEKMKNNYEIEEITIGNHEFKLVHIKFKKQKDEKHHIALCGDKRCVSKVSLSTIFGNKPLDSEDGKFMYSAYVSSKYLDNNINPERNGFRIPDKLKLNEYNVRNLQEGDPSLEEVITEVTNVAKLYLKDYLEEVESQKKEKVLNYITGTNPSLKCVYETFPEQILKDVKVGMKNEDIADILYKYKGKAENQALTEAKSLLNVNERELIDKSSSIDNINETISKIHNIRKNDLAGYVFHRYRILQLFQKKLELNQNKEYSLESEIHDLIFPRKKDSSEVNLYDHNLWILDDRLAFHSYATSDLEIKKISDSDSNKRPDILIFKEDTKRGIASSVTIVELKRPNRDDAHIEDQIFDYLRDLKDKQISTAQGRPIHTTDETIYYCYAICDFQKYNSQIKNMVEQGDYKELMGELGYYRYNKNFNAHIEIIAYDKLVSDAKLRNNVWFDKSGLDINGI